MFIRSCPQRSFVALSNVVVTIIGSKLYLSYLNLFKYVCVGGGIFLSFCLSFIFVRACWRLSVFGYVIAKPGIVRRQQARSKSIF